jgi:hypothetical protein
MNWYVFKAYNSQAIYAYGTEHEADKYCDALNNRAIINLYSYEVCNEKMSYELENERNDGFNLSDYFEQSAEYFI